MPLALRARMSVATWQRAQLRSGVSTSPAPGCDDFGSERGGQRETWRRGKAGSARLGGGQARWAGEATGIAAGIEGIEGGSEADGGSEARRCIEASRGQARRAARGEAGIAAASNRALSLLQGRRRQRGEAVQRGEARAARRGGQRGGQRGRALPVNCTLCVVCACAC